MPAVKVTPLGKVPDCINAGAGVPVAVTVKVPALNTVKVVALALVTSGGTGVAVGVTGQCRRVHHCQLRCLSARHRCRAWRWSNR